MIYFDFLPSSLHYSNGVGNSTAKPSTEEETKLTRFGVSIRNYRQRKSWDVDQFAEKLGIAPSDVSNLETGILTHIEPSTAKKICQLFDLRFNDLLPNCPEDVKKFGAKLKNLRESQNVTVMQLSEKVHCENIALLTMEHGLLYNQTLASRIADEFHMTLKELIAWQPPSEKSATAPSVSHETPVTSKEKYSDKQQIDLIAGASKSRELDLESAKLKKIAAHVVGAQATSKRLQKPITLTPAPKTQEIRPVSTLNKTTTSEKGRFDTVTEGISPVLPNEINKSAGQLRNFVPTKPAPKMPETRIVNPTLNKTQVQQYFSIIQRKPENVEERKTFGEAVKGLRMALKLTQKTLANNIGCSSRMVGQIEIATGYSANFASKINHYFCKTIPVFMGWQPPSEKSAIPAEHLSKPEQQRAGVSTEGLSESDEPDLGQEEDKNTIKPTKGRASINSGSTSYDLAGIAAEKSATAPSVSHETPVTSKEKYSDKQRIDLIAGASKSRELDLESAKLKKIAAHVVGAQATSKQLQKPITLTPAPKTQEIRPVSTLNKTTTSEKGRFDAVTEGISPVVPNEINQSAGQLRNFVPTKPTPKMPETRIVNPTLNKTQVQQHFSIIQRKPETVEERKQFGAAVKGLRMALKLNQKELAANIGCHRVMVARMETAARRHNNESASKIVDYFCKTIPEVMGWHTPSEKSATAPSESQVLPLTSDDKFSDKQQIDLTTNELKDLVSSKPTLNTQERSKEVAASSETNVEQRKEKEKDVSDNEESLIDTEDESTEVDDS